MGYEGLKWVTRVCKGLQGGTWGFKGLQVVTRGYRDLEEVRGVTVGFKGLLGI